MELRTLRYFLTVAREESISGAAAFLHVTQPTLSRQLMELEDQLGKKLFIRGNRKITLTDEGMLLRKRAEEILDLVDKTQTEISAEEQIVSGDIYIGGGETKAMGQIARISKEMQSLYPNIKFHLYSGNADEVTERLDKGLLDFGVLIEPANITKYDYLPLSSKDVWGVLMRKDSPLASKEAIAPSDLLDVPLISSRQSLVHKELARWFQCGYERLNIVAIYNLVYNASLLVAEDMGYALCLDKLVNTTGSSMFCFRPLAPKLEAKLNIVWKKYQIFSKAAAIFLDRLHEELENN